MNVKVVSGLFLLLLVASAAPSSDRALRPAPNVMSLCGLDTCTFTRLQESEVTIPCDEGPTNCWTASCINDEKSNKNCCLFEYSCCTMSGRPYKAVYGYDTSAGCVQEN
jgi:hypothetical protein